MRQKLILLISLFHFIYSAGQETGLLNELENSFLQIRQKPGTDEMLSQWLSNAGVKEDTIYAYFYSPATCRRCENSLNDYRKAINKHGKKFLLITVHKDKEAAKFYNKRHSYKADYFIYDTTEKYAKIFSFNNIPFNTSNILKITKQGRVVTGFDCMAYGSKLVTELMQRSKPMDYKNFDEHVDEADIEYKYPISKAKIAGVCNTYKDYKLTVSDDVPLCETNKRPIFKGDTFMYPDLMLEKTIIFKKNRLSGNQFDFKRAIEVDDKVKDMFVKLDSADYNMKKRTGTLYYMLISSEMLENGDIGMSYSLPNLFYEKKDQIAYYNQPCILFHKGGKDTTDSYTSLDFPESKFFYMHFQFSATEKSIFLGCSKSTWPYCPEPNEYRGKKDIDPFMAEFYNARNPFMAEFDRNTGKRIREFGNISDIAEKTRTGYYFVSPLSVISQGEVAYTDGYSGKVYVADVANAAKAKNCYTIFNIMDEDLPKMDTTEFYKYEYAKPYRSVFCRCITDMRITPQKVYCLVTYGNLARTDDPDRAYSFVSIDRKTGKRLEHQYPKAEGYTVFTRGLREKDGKVMPFELLKRDGEAWLRVYGTDEKAE